MLCLLVAPLLLAALPCQWNGRVYTHMPAKHSSITDHFPPKKHKIMIEAVLYTLKWNSFCCWGSSILRQIMPALPWISGMSYPCTMLQAVQNA